VLGGGLLLAGSKTNQSLLRGSPQPRIAAISEWIEDPDLDARMGVERDDLLIAGDCVLPYRTARVFSCGARQGARA
jgi:hypothetical protein